jgi:hypothetical protein
MVSHSHSETCNKEDKLRQEKATEKLRKKQKGINRSEPGKEARKSE